jgi:hypothetical protein
MDRFYQYEAEFAAAIPKIRRTAKLCRKGTRMLTQAEMKDARDDLRQAESLIGRTRGVFLSAGYARGARLLKAALGMIADEIAALDKAMRTKP